MHERILVVEDEAVVAELVCAILGENGFDATYAPTGEDALDRLAGGEAIDLVLMDIYLGPGHIDGGAAARLINERHGIPLIFYSGRDDALTLGKTREEDCYGYVRKGSGSSEYLVRSIRTALHRHSVAETLTSTVAFRNLHAEEANHRIVNGLTMVRSFLELKQRSVELECDLSDVIARIEALSQLHSMVSVEGSGQVVVLQPLVTGILSRVFAAAPFPVETSCDLGALTLPYTDARALGLAVAEVATNAVKHSFCPGCENRFELYLVPPPEGDSGPSDAPEHLEVVADMNGFPIDDSVDLDDPERQGLRILRALVRQFGGRLTIRRSPTPRFTIAIPRERIPG